MGEREALPSLEDIAVVRSRVSERLGEVDRVLAVMSGKGGVGKSLVAANLALALARRGARTAILDADLNSPSLARMLGLRGQPLRVGPSGVRPVEGPLGIAVQSMDFLLQGAGALDWDGPRGEGAGLRSALEEAALGGLLGETDWGARDVLLIDLAPGPDRLPALVRLLPELTGALAVTIPTEVSLLSVERSVRRACEARVPTLGLVENLALGVCARCGAVAPLFQEVSLDARAAALGLEVVARIPFDAALAAAADAGRLAEGFGSLATRAFEDLAGRVTGFRAQPGERDSW